MLLQAQRILPIEPVALVVCFDPIRKELLTGPPTQAQQEWTLHQYLTHCRTSILDALASTRQHPHRVLCALAGFAFIPENPRPIGGKRYPGYQKFKGAEPKDILPWLLSTSLRPEWEVGRRRPPHPAELLTCVVIAVNRVLAAHFPREDAPNYSREARREALDHHVLAGMKKAGFVISTETTSGRVELPASLRERRRSRRGGGVGEGRDAEEVDGAWDTLLSAPAGFQGDAAIGAASVDATAVVAPASPLLVHPSPQPGEVRRSWRFVSAQEHRQTTGQEDDEEETPRSDESAEPFRYDHIEETVMVLVDHEVGVGATVSTDPADGGVARGISSAASLESLKEEEEEEAADGAASSPSLRAEMIEMGQRDPMAVANHYVLLASIEDRRWGTRLNWWHVVADEAKVMGSVGVVGVVEVDGKGSEKLATRACDVMTRRFLEAKMDLELLRRKRAKMMVTRAKEAFDGLRDVST